MKNFFFKTTTLVLAVFIFAPSFALAHQPRLNTQIKTTVTEPEISKAYYGQLADKPHFYNIKTESPFDLYVNILVPDIKNQKSDIFVAIVNNKNIEAPIAVLDGTDFEWKRFWEPFGRDWYLMGPEYKAHVGAGEYSIIVWSDDKDVKYSLAIGETESFNLRESINALRLIPQIKTGFFNESPANFILSPFGYGYILTMYVLAFIVGFIYRTILKRLSQNPIRRLTKNIGLGDRLLRLTLGVILLVWAITTSWNPAIIFFSGFCLFEAVFSWCGFYAALGKNTCPIEN